MSAFERDPALLLIDLIGAASKAGALKSRRIVGRSALYHRRRNQLPFFVQIGKETRFNQAGGCHVIGLIR